MKNLSPLGAAILISLIITALSGAIVITNEMTHPLPTVWMIAGGLFVLFLVCLILMRVYLSAFIAHKIYPIYKLVQHRRPTPRDFRRKSMNPELDSLKQHIDLWMQQNERQIDQLKQIERYRKEFIGNVSHELKTPIFNIQGYILTLLDGGLEDPSINRLYLERSEKSINRMISIVEDLESISRLESGELRLKMEDFNIVSLVQEVFEMQDRWAKEAKIQLELFPGTEKVIKVSADKKRINEVLGNLIINSIRYGKKNGKTVVSFFDSGHQILVEVADTGIGIDPMNQSRIFERFYRCDKARSRDQGGTGLGLSIVKHIIEAHHQTITVRSEPGKGSVFTFSLDKAAGNRKG